MASIKELVAERVAGLGPSVQDSVVATLADQVKDKRVKAILTALNFLEEKAKELKKIKPVETFDETGKVASSAFDKTSNESRKKINEAVAQVEKALAEALDPEKPNFEKLFKALQNKGGAAPASGEEAAE
jgi:molecular chaperone DnaK (HSP70)